MSLRVKFMYTKFMIWILLFVLELSALFYLSQEVTKKLSAFLMRITRNQKTTIYIISALFFPGVFVHEFAHLILANALFVKTGEVEFFPQIEGDKVKLGSVTVAKSDPLRRFFIGVAPILFGVAIMFGLFFYLSPFFPGYNWQTAVLIYLFFEIGNTMFSSKKDMEGAIALGVAVLVLILAFFLLGVRIQVNFLSFFDISVISYFLKTSCLLFLIPLLINILALGINKLVNK